tara:strand:- start:431 stop:796 length:366 start_codon:yes stop_codon:yes gene_type:complete
MTQSRRIQKVASLLKREITLIFNNDLEDRLISDNFISITNIEISSDLYYCKIYVSSSLAEDTKIKVIDSLNNSKSFIRHKLSQRIDMRRIPELIFKIDKALENGNSVLRVLDKLRDEKNQT